MHFVTLKCQSSNDHEYSNDNAKLILSMFSVQITDHEYSNDNAKLVLSMFSVQITHYYEISVDSLLLCLSYCH